MKKNIKNYFTNMRSSNILNNSIILTFMMSNIFAIGLFFSIITFVFNGERDFFANAFKDPASPVMEGIIDFHHDVFFFLVIILIFVSWFLIRILSYNVISENIQITRVSILKKPSHIQSLEFIWTIIPTLILFAIAGPSFTLLYAMNELLTPSITVKAIGHQWYWVYEIADPYVEVFDEFKIENDSVKNLARSFLPPELFNLFNIPTAYAEELPIPTKKSFDRDIIAEIKDLGERYQRYTQSKNISPELFNYSFEELFEIILQYDANISSYVLSSIPKDKFHNPMWLYIVSIDYFDQVALYNNYMLHCHSATSKLFVEWLFINRQLAVDWMILHPEASQNIEGLYAYWLTWLLKIKNTDEFIRFLFALLEDHEHLLSHNVDSKAIKACPFLIEKK